MIPVHVAAAKNIKSAAWFDLSTPSPTIKDVAGCKKVTRLLWGLINFSPTPP